MKGEYYNKPLMFDFVYTIFFLIFIVLGAGLIDMSFWLYSLPNHACYDLCIYPYPAMLGIALLVGDVALINYLRGPPKKLKEGKK
jgi:hypothetical protein